jgi:hypothetical protein
MLVRDRFLNAYRESKLAKTLQSIVWSPSDAEARLSIRRVPAAYTRVAANCTFVVTDVQIAARRISRRR